MKVFLLLLFLFTTSTAAFSHGSKEDCSKECNDYYCPPEMNRDKEKKFPINK
tara:strand:+ start:457 stop:612 length:156 start_codon:yes stop_codon:yes gene_type:complete